MPENPNNDNFELEPQPEQEPLQSSDKPHIVDVNTI